MHRWSAFGVTTLLSVLTTPARADTFGAQAHYVVGQGAFDGVELKSPALMDGPPVIERSSPKLRGMGTLEGFGFRGEYLADRYRLGVGSTILGASGVGLRTKPLPYGLSARLAQLWSVSSELFVGYEVKQGPVYAYIDGRLSFQVLQAQIETHAEPFGHVGTSAYTAFSPAFGPRFGALVPVGHSLTLDIYAYRTMLGGYEQITVGVGVGYWENDRNDAFSDELRGSWRGEF